MFSANPHSIKLFLLGLKLSMFTCIFYTYINLSYLDFPRRKETENTEREGTGTEEGTGSYGKARTGTAQLPRQKHSTATALLQLHEEKTG